MQIDCQSYGCMECCKRYWISLLPDEAKRIAHLRNEPISDFLHEHCLLDLQLFPTSTTSQLTIPVSAFAMQTQKKIKTFFASKPAFMLVLPSVAFKRTPDGSCEFLETQSGLCTVYEERPNQCRLFPFISFDQKPLHAQYPFCAFLQDHQPSTNPFEKDLLLQKKLVYHYFDAVAKKGFAAQWPALPEKGIIRIAGRVIGRVTQKQFLCLLMHSPQVSTKKNTIPTI